ncbi:MAG: hypothetical protein CL878_11855 [Dehalococcoidia bacterium]|nr:hypothetical protein [Dehalococcoidia bacterium]
MRLAYDLLYRFGAPWEIGPRKELVQLVEDERIWPGRAIDLGCGTGDNAIFLAQHGFDVTGVDYTPYAIAKAKRKAAAAGVDVEFLVGDLTDLHGVTGTFDFLVDYGTLDDLSEKSRESYLHNVLPLSRPGSQFLLWGFEWELRWWERAMRDVLKAAAAFTPGEVEQRFGPHFQIERIASESREKGWMLGYAAYLMTAREEVRESSLLMTGQATF